jgi:hypothetical protein
MPEYPGRSHLKDPTLPEWLRGRGYPPGYDLRALIAEYYGLDDKGRPKYPFECVADPCQMNNMAGPAPELDALTRAWDSATPWMKR